MTKRCTSSRLWSPVALETLLPCCVVQRSWDGVGDGSACCRSPAAAHSLLHCSPHVMKFGRALTVPRPIWLTCSGKLVECCVLLSDQMTAVSLPTPPTRTRNDNNHNNNHNNNHQQHTTTHNNTQQHKTTQNTTASDTIRGQRRYSPTNPNLAATTTLCRRKSAPLTHNHAQKKCSPTSPIEPTCWLWNRTPLELLRLRQNSSTLQRVDQERANMNFNVVQKLPLTHYTSQKEQL